MIIKMILGILLYRSLRVKIIRQLCIKGVSASAQVVGVGDVDEGAVGVAGEEVIFAEPGELAGLVVIGYAVHIV